MYLELESYCRGFQSKQQGSAAGALLRNINFCPDSKSSPLTILMGFQFLSTEKKLHKLKHRFVVSRFVFVLFQFLAIPRNIFRNYNLHVFGSEFDSLGHVRISEG